MSATTHRPPPVQQPGDNDPDPEGFNPLWLHPLAVTLWLAFLAIIRAWSGLPSWWWAGVGVVLALVARVAINRWVSEAEHGPGFYGRARRAVVAGVLAAHAWLIYAGLPATPVPAAVGSLTGLALCGTAVYAWLRTSGVQHAEVIREERAEAVAEYRHTRLVSDLATLWNAWFARVRVAVQVADAVDTPAGYTLMLDVEPDETGAIPRFSDFTSAVPALAPLVSKHYAAKGKDIAVDQLRPEETEQAHRWLLHVSTERPLRQVLRHPGDRGAASILEPCDFGIYEDGKPLQLMLYGAHTLMVGSTGSGKSVLLHNTIAEVTRRGDEELWIGTTSKLMPVVWPWLLPWLTGRTARPVIERVAGQGLDEVLLMLRDLYEYGMARNARLGPFGAKHRPTLADPGLFVIIDEATHPAKNKTARVFTSDGREWTAAQLFDACCAMLRSAGGSMFFFTQYGLVDALGNEGTNTLRNITVRIAGRTEKDFDGQQTLSGMDRVRTSRLRDNTLLVQPSAETPRVLSAKTYFLEEPEQIDALAVAHTRYRGSGLPAWLVDKLGGSYTERWWPDRQPTLVEACELAGIPYPVLPGGAMREGFTTIPNTIVADRVTSTGMSGAVDMNDGSHKPTPTPPAPSGTGAERGADQHNPAPRFTAAANGDTIDAMTTTHDNHAAGPVASHARDGAVVKDPLARLNDARERHAAALRDIRDYGPFGKANTLVYRIFHAKGAPESATAADLALLAIRVDDEQGTGLIDPGNHTGAELAAATKRVVENVARLGGIPAQRTPGEDPDNPVIHRTQFVAAWEAAKADYIAKFPAPDTSAAAPGFAAAVLDAVRHLPDHEWLAVADLGRAAGQIPDGEDTAAVREAARQFSIRLRTEFGVSDDNGMKRTARGSTVHVGALRAARVTA